MANLLVDERDAKFVLYEQLKIDELCQHERFSELSREMFDMVLEAAQKLGQVVGSLAADIQGIEDRKSVV